jgi:redox-sensitive bicupin YhaK (pirin superfamily)
MSAIIRRKFPLGFPWTTFDPFLFCVHHDDAYPAGNATMGPATSLAGRNIGSDFEGKDGWSMYHGDRIPGFPRHPHRGFETLSLARRGFIDHSDSLGAKARFGKGDAQWMTAGRGIVHSEMFPLISEDTDNPGELFQLWINLPAVDKMVPPNFAMLWSEDIPRISFVAEQGKTTEVVAVAGSPAGHPDSPKPPPSSWASRPDSDLAVWTIKLEPGAQWTMPAAKPGTDRALYYFRGAGVEVAGTELTKHCGLQVQGDVAISFLNGGHETEFLLLQGKPIDEPVAHYGPFVMNSSAEIQQAIADYRSTEYGEWPWSEDDPVHEREQGRFAVHADGREDRPAS